MVDYTYYRDTFAGSLNETDFKKMEFSACDVLDAYIASLVPSDRVRPLSDYEFNLQKQVCYEADYLYTAGGENLINGEMSPLSIKSVETDNFKYQYGSEKVDKIGNLPIHPLCVSYIKQQLDKYGYRNKVVRQCLKCRDF